MRHWSGYKNWQTHAIMTWDIMGRNRALTERIEDIVAESLCAGPGEPVPGRHIVYADWLLQELGRIIKDALDENAMADVFSYARVADDDRWVEDMWRGAFDDVAWTEIAIAATRGAEAYENASVQWKDEIDARYRREHGRS